MLVDWSLGVTGAEFNAKAIKAVKMVIIVINWDLQILAPAKPDKLLASKIRSLGEGAYLNVGITNRSTL